MRHRQAIMRVIETVPECVGAGLLACSQGSVLDVGRTPPDDPRIFQRLAPHIESLLDAATIFAIERTIAHAAAKADDRDAPASPHEAIVRSSDLLLLFVRMPASDEVLVVVAKHDASIGSILTRARSAARAH